MHPTDPERPAYKIRGPETWAMIREAYLAGAPAKVLAARYDVTKASVYARASRENWQKGRRADRAPSGPLPAFAVPGGGSGSRADAASERPPIAWAPSPDIDDPADLARAALRGVGAAMREGRLDDAKSLGQLADVLSRVSVRAPQSGLETVARALHDLDFRSELLGIWGDPNPDPVKTAYWAEEGRRRQAQAARDCELRDRDDALKAELDRLRALVARVAPGEATDGPG